MRDAIVYGRFVYENKLPVEGVVRFEPSRLWIDEESPDGDLSFATLAPVAELADGRFSVALTRTDTCVYPWHYTVTCPMGRWTISVDQEGPINLKALLPKSAHEHRPRPTA